MNYHFMTNEIITMCSEIEKKLSGDFHVALTGSTLYGKQSSRRPDEPPVDIDVIIYPHIRDQKSAEVAPPRPKLNESYLQSIGFEVTPQEKKTAVDEFGNEYPLPAGKIWKCKYGGVAVDVIHLK